MASNWFVSEEAFKAQADAERDAKTVHSWEELEEGIIFAIIRVQDVFSTKYNTDCYILITFYYLVNLSLQLIVAFCLRNIKFVPQKVSNSSANIDIKIQHKCVQLSLFLQYSFISNPTLKNTCSERFHSHQDDFINSRDFTCNCLLCCLMSSRGHRRTTGANAIGSLAPSQLSILATSVSYRFIRARCLPSKSRRPVAESCRWSKRRCKSAQESPIFISIYF